MNTAMFVDFEPLRREVANHQVEPLDPSEVAFDLLQRAIHRLEREDRDKVILRRAYADWEGMGLSGIPVRLAGAGIRPVYVPSSRTRAVEMEMVLDASEVMLTRSDVGRFLLLGGDRDLCPLVRRLREAGRQVLLLWYRDTLAPELWEAVGRGGFLSASQILMGEPESETLPPSFSVAPPLRPLPSPPVAFEGAKVEDVDLEATRALLQAARARFGGEVPLVSFYKDFMNPELHHLNNEGRKRLVAELERQGEVVVQVRSDSQGVRYAVVLAPDGHSGWHLLAQVEATLVVNGVGDEEGEAREVGTVAGSLSGSAVLE